MLLQCRVPWSISVWWDGVVWYGTGELVQEDAGMSLSTYPLLQFLLA
jgi:hypothetical protein